VIICSGQDDVENGVQAFRLVLVDKPEGLDSNIRLTTTKIVIIGNKKTRQSDMI